MKLLFLKMDKHSKLSIGFKSLIYSALFLIILFTLLSFSKYSLESVRGSVNIFLNSLLPSLLPFMILSEIALFTDIFKTISNTIGKILSKIFMIPKESTIAIILGFLCGFPAGGTAVNRLYEAGTISKKQAYILLSFVNNNNPAFILATIGIGAFKNLSIGIILFISHYLAAIIIGIIYSRYSAHIIIHENTKNSNNINKNIEKNRHIDENIHNKSNNTTNAVDILRKCILNSFVTLGTVFGFILIFNLMFDLLNNIVLVKLNLPNDIIYILSGFVEITRGSFNILNLNLNLTYIICIESFLLGFSGMCILFQIYSTICTHNFSFSKLFLFKLVQGILSASISYLLIRYTNIFNIQSIAILNQIDRNIEYENFKSLVATSYIHSLALILFVLSVYMIFVNLRKNKKVK